MEVRAIYIVLVSPSYLVIHVVCLSSRLLLHILEKGKRHRHMFILVGYAF